MKKPIPLPIHSYRDYSPVVGAERLVNCYVEQAPPKGKSPYSFGRAPGIVTAATPAAGAGRGVYNWQGQLYAVVGTTFYHVSSGYVLTAIGTVAIAASGLDLVSFAENPTQLVICASSASYVYDGTTYTQITDADFANGAQACSIDGYVLFREPGSGRFFASDLNNALSYDALFFATAEGLADNITGIIADHRQAILAGEKSMEIWYNAGISGFPFIRDANGFVEMGCAAGRTLAKVDNSVFWLASDLTVRRLDGTTPLRISHHGVEQAIGEYDVTDAYGVGYTWNGHLFYVLVFPGQATWVYDATTQLWHERQTYNQTDWKVAGFAQCYQKWFVQNVATGQIGYLDRETFTEFDAVQRLEGTFEDVYSNGDLLTHHSLELIAETGVGTSIGQGSNPQLTLEKSNDSGRTWITLPTKSLGAIGSFKTRVTWQSLGASRFRRYRVSYSDPTKLVIADAVVEVS